MGFRMLRTAAALVTVLLLAGCVPREPVITPEPDPASTPVFASDEEALAAATEAYARYQQILDSALGTHDGTKIESVAIDPALANALELVATYDERGWRQVGQSSIGSTRLASSELDQSRVQIYLCHDLEGVGVLDADGESVVSADRPSQTPSIAMLAWSSELEQFRVEEDEVWTGVNFC